MKKEMQEGVTFIRATREDEITLTPVAHQEWCASLTQQLLSYPAQPAPCNCAPLAKQREWVGLTEDDKRYLNEVLNLQGRFPVIDAIEAKLREKNK